MRSVRNEVRTLAWSEMSYNKYQSDDIVEEKQRPMKKNLGDTYNLRLQKRQEMERKRQERLKNKYKGEQQ